MLWIIFLAIFNHDLRFHKIYKGNSCLGTTSSSRSCSWFARVLFTVHHSMQDYSLSQDCHPFWISGITHASISLAFGLMHSYCLIIRGSRWGQGEEAGTCSRKKIVWMCVSSSCFLHALWSTGIITLRCNVTFIALDEKSRLRKAGAPTQ